MDPSWKLALVTGASSGIGKAIAAHLAAAGTDLVLVARDVERLQQLAADLGAAHGITVEVMAADLTDAAERNRIEARLGREPAVDLLVNNAGFGTFGPLVDLPVDTEENEIELNVVALVRLTRAALPAMMARNAGTILNVASMAGLQPVPRNATYGATKAFVINFTESVHEEMRGTGVGVTCLLPGFTRTEFQARAGLGDTGGVPSFAWQSAEECAAAGLAGAAAGKAIVVPGALNRVTAAVAGPIPRGMKRRIVSRMSGRFGE